MIDLAQRAEPYQIGLPYSLTVTVKPLTTAGMAAAQSAARRAVEARQEATAPHQLVQHQARHRGCGGCDELQFVVARAVAN